MVEQDATPAPAAATKTTRHRSPNYPVISLGKGIELATKLYAQDHSTAVPVSVACGHWGVKITSSSGMRLVSAMQSYGLIEIVGAGAAKKLKLTERGLILVRHPDKASVAYRDALREAALAPKIHEEIWNEYEATGLPSTQSLHWSLESDWKVHPESIPALIAELVETFTLAGITSAAKVEDAKGDKGDIPPMGKPAGTLPKDPPAATPPSESMTMANASSGSVLRDQPLPLLSGDAVLRYPHPMSEEDFDWMLETIQRLKRKFLQPAQAGTPPPAGTSQPPTA